MISGLFTLPFAPVGADDAASRAAMRYLPQGADQAFVAGPENALVRSLCAAMDSPHVSFSPLVVCGPAGVGKSCLAHALAARRHQRLHLLSVILTTGAELARGLAHAIDTASASDFRAHHHRCDLLVIDDLHQLADKAPAQRFLLAALDALLRRGALVIATLRQPPQATLGLAPALVSRLASGLVVELAPPGLLARGELVRRSAARAELALDDAQVKKLAGTSDQPVHRVRTPAQIHHAVLQLAAGSRFAVGQQPAAGEPPDVKSICRHVTAAAAKYFGLTLAELKGKSRRQAVADARGLAMYIARRLTAASYAELGRHFGGRDHTTVLHACRKVTQSAKHDPTIRRIIEELTAEVACEPVS